MAFRQLAQVAPDVAPGLRIEADGGFVQEQNVGGVQDAARDLESPFHAAGKGHYHRLGAIGQVDHLEGTGNPCRTLGGRHVVHEGVELEVLLCRQLPVE